MKYDIGDVDLTEKIHAFEGRIKEVFLKVVKFYLAVKECMGVTQGKIISGFRTFINTVSEFITCSKKMKINGGIMKGVLSLPSVVEYTGSTKQYSSSQSTVGGHDCPFTHVDT